MNPLYISGRIKDKKRVEKYIRDIAEELGINQHYTKYLEITFTSKLDGDSQGFCWGDKETHAEIEIARTLCGKRLSVDQMMKTLAHEMVHAKQYIFGELDGYSDSWKGSDVNYYSYEDSPWEKEAYKLEEILYEKFWKKT